MAEDDLELLMLLSLPLEGMCATIIQRRKDIKLAVLNAFKQLKETTQESEHSGTHL